MHVKCGKYKHFKGNEYSVYGSARTALGEEFVLYRQEYGSRDFWIRPLGMFYDKVSFNGKDKIERFKFLSKLNIKNQISELVEILKKSNIKIIHSETGGKYFISSINETTYDVIIAQFSMYSSYLTDTQLSRRMGYDLFMINGKATVKKTCFPLPNKQHLTISLPDKKSDDYQTETIINNQMNACSIDLHIADEFYKPKFNKIDMTNVFHHSVKPEKLWKKLNMKRINGSEGFVIWPHQTIITRTYEKIALPFDCAGKIEIKSTYSRLALSVTASDFCNPG